MKRPKHNAPQSIEDSIQRGFHHDGGARMMVDDEALNEISDREEQNEYIMYEEEIYESSSDDDRGQLNHVGDDGDEQFHHLTSNRSSSSDEDNRQDIQIKVQARKALKDSKHFLHSTTRNLEHKITFSQNNSLMNKMLESRARNKSVSIEKLLQQMMNRNSRDWFLDLSFEQCYSKIRNAMREITFKSERNKKRTTSSKSEGKNNALINLDKIDKPKKHFQHSSHQALDANDETTMTMMSKKQHKEKKHARTDNRNHRENPEGPPTSVTTPRKPLHKAPSKQLPKKQKKSRPVKPYQASEEEMIALESYFGPEMAMEILQHADIFVSFQKFWRANRKYRFNRKVQELRSMFQTTLFEMERAKLENYDTEDYARQIKYLAAQFCAEMNPSKPYTPGPLKQSQLKHDKHSFLHRKEDPTFLKKVKKKKKRESNNTTSPPQQQPSIDDPTMHEQPAVTTTPLRSDSFEGVSPSSTEHTSPNNEQQTTSSTPKRTPPIPSPSSAFKSPVKTIGSISPKHLTQSSNNNPEIVQPTTPKRMMPRKTFSSRVFKIQTKLGSNNNNNSDLQDSPEAKFTFDDALDSSEKDLIESDNKNESVHTSSTLASNVDCGSPRQTLDGFSHADNASSVEIHDMKELSGTNIRTSCEEKDMNQSLENVPENEDVNISRLSQIPPLSPILRRAPPPPVTDDQAEQDETKSSEGLLDQSGTSVDNHQSSDNEDEIVERRDDLESEDRVNQSSFSEDESTSSADLEFEQKLQMESKYFSPKILFMELEKANHNRLSSEVSSGPNSDLSDEEKFKELHILHKTDDDDFLPNTQNLITTPSFENGSERKSFKHLESKAGSALMEPNSIFKKLGTSNNSRDSQGNDNNSPPSRAELPPLDPIGVTLSRNTSSLSQEGSSTPRPPSRKPPQPSLSLEELVERDRTRFAEIENLVFSSDESSIIFQFDRNFVYSGFKN
ncbi:hypothetical protein FDP41_008316 [Naegleria fowleri]|uniref:Uncharacterized protein n=1 Tax=Naegleria fowleri TaxID=5763 RepID=A0A6A5BFM5_NAEFO|nr:uncharacterized protein FDP41_008316 [Naegleria fowleri]KAF0973612.1 hypothetical protein FDP41_008316 [Naegleria fowleri]